MILDCSANAFGTRAVFMLIYVVLLLFMTQHPMGKVLRERVAFVWWVIVVCSCVPLLVDTVQMIVCGLLAH